MDAENGKMKTEYSPLNNLTSSGEDVEQFSLPVTTSSADRPKRRRKRKDFDSLKAHTLPSMHRTGLCSCAACFTAITFCILVASVCGLGAIVYSLSDNVDKMQKQIDNLQVAKGSTSDTLLSVKSDAEKQLKQLNLQLLNMTTLLSANSDNITKLSEKMKSIVIQHNDKTSTSDSQEVQQQLAKFGSDITSLKGDVASLKQDSQSLGGRLDSLDQSVQNIYSLSLTKGDPRHGTTAQDTSAHDEQQMEILRNSIQSVNETCNLKIGAVNLLLQKTDANFNSYKLMANHSMNSVREDLQALRENLDVDVSEVNRTLQHEDNSNQQLDLGLSHGEDNSSMEAVSVLTERVDQLEAYVREVSQKLDSKLTTELENNVINLTMATGMEDIISRVINQKLTDYEKPTHEVSLQVARLEAKMIRLEDNFKSLTNIVHENWHTTPKPPIAEGNIPTLTSAAMEVTTEPNENVDRVKPTLNTEQTTEDASQEKTTEDVPPLNILKATATTIIPPSPDKKVNSSEILDAGDLANILGQHSDSPTTIGDIEQS